MQLIFHMETLFETLNCPQAATERRSFQEKTNGLLPRPRYDPRQQPAKPKNLRGEIATFQVWVLFRQHASWQGKVTWLEKNRECKFRSALELFFLMDSTIMLGEKSDMQEPFLTEEEKKRLVI